VKPFTTSLEKWTPSLSRISSRRLSATDQGFRPTAQFAAVLSDNRNAVADSVVCHAEALTKSTDEVSWIALCRVR